MTTEFTPDNFLDRAEDESVIFTDFVDKVSIYKENGIYCFIEDYDMPYYTNPLRFLVTQKTVSIRCRGKSKVLEIHDSLKNHPIYNKYVKRFFVDKDFDDNSALDKDIYITPGYAIENFYVSNTFISQILTTEYDIDSVTDKEAFIKAMNLFITMRDSYNEAILLFNSWYACLHDMDGWNHRGVKLGIEFPKKWIKINWGTNVVQKYDLSHIENRYPDAPKIKNEVIEEKSKILSTNMYQQLRGKYEIEFLCKFFDYFNEDGATNKVYNVKGKNVTTTKDKAISHLAQYADIPDSLKEYIKIGRIA